MMSNSSLLLRLAGLSSNRKFQRIIVQELEKSKDYIDQNFWFGKNLRQFQGRTSVRQPWKESCHKIESLCAPHHIARQLECALNVSPIHFYSTFGCLWVTNPWIQTTDACLSKVFSTLPTSSPKSSWAWWPTCSRSKGYNNNPFCVKLILLNMEVALF